jgi:hypothetical protein
MLHQWHMLSSSVTEEYDHAGSSECYPTPNKRLPWNKGKLIGAKPPLQPKHLWSIRTKLQIEGRAHDLAMFNLAIDNKLRGCNPAHERPLCARSGQRKTNKLLCHLLSVSGKTITLCFFPTGVVSNPLLWSRATGGTARCSFGFSAMSSLGPPRPGAYRPAVRYSAAPRTSPQGPRLRCLSADRLERAAAPGRSHQPLSRRWR